MSASRQAINTTNAPAPRPFYNQAIVANGLVFCSGQVPRDANGNSVTSSIEAQTNQCIKNLKAVLEAAGSDLEHTVEVNVFLDDINNFDVMNAAYQKWFGEIKPARTCVAVKNLPGGDVNVEIKCIGLVK